MDVDKIIEAMATVYVQLAEEIVTLRKENERLRKEIEHGTQANPISD